MEQNLSSPNPRPNLTYPYTASNGVTYDPPPNGWKVTPEKMRELDRLGKLHFPTKGSRLRLKNYLDEGLGVPAQDLWTDITVLGGTSPERLGYPTQKPVALLERIIRASSDEGSIVLDPFCGCGTTIDAAQRLKRRWIGIDITFIAIDLIQKRLHHTFGPAIAKAYSVYGIPRDIEGAHALFEHSPFDFERWAVSQVGATPNEKQVGDKGKDGVALFTGTGRMIVSVKGGKSVVPAYVQELSGAMMRHKADMGVLVIMAAPSKGVVDEVNHSGTYTWPGNYTTFPRIQVITVDQLLNGERPKTPPLRPAYNVAARVPNTDWAQDVMSAQGD